MRQPKLFNKLLIANRGEIAIRIARAATELNIKTVGIYAYEDRFSLHRYKTDESYQVGKQSKPLEAYLNYEQIIHIAKACHVDAIHPGYGFLSENAAFAKACEQEGIQFIGPSPQILDTFGDKVKARQVVETLNIPVIPGTQSPLRSVDEACQLAKTFSYPVTLKAVLGGGGKGIRMIHDESSLRESYARACSEAKTSFGKSDLYLEKQILNPRHIEVQILGDSLGQVVHLYERDCSIQRRHQKVVEIAPALNLDKALCDTLRSYALRIARHLRYSGLGTIEFLVGEDNQCYFLEVNPRVQVEHTVTEMITGVDLIQASILVAAQYPLSDPRIGISTQNEIQLRGVAIQCRITTEDPLADFAPSFGRIIAYRSASGYGVRLDEGYGTSGGLVTPHYDSLLVKVTTWHQQLSGAAAKMHRCLSEFRIRGVRHNIPLLKNIVTNPDFLKSQINTSFFSTHPEVFKYIIPRDRATKMLHYLANTTLNNPHHLEHKKKFASQSAHVVVQDYSDESLKTKTEAKQTAKTIYDEQGVTGLLAWIKSQSSLLLTDTTMRDAHQSLFATRLRTQDMLRAAPLYRAYGQDFFSLEVWGGATFDSCYRFLKEDPWERLSQIREALPNTLLQMLFRGDNAVGYTNYPKWVIKEFIKETIHTGLDLFRIFDCLNQIDKMQTAVDSVKENGAIAEVCMSYTGDVSDAKRAKYDLAYYVGLAKQIEAMGADILCIKDMAGLLKPKAARLLISTLKDECGLPIHLHTHDTSGTGIAMYLEAHAAQCDIIDGALNAMSGFTSQPSLNALVASLQGDAAAPKVALSHLERLSRYWEGVRPLYDVFDPGLRSNSSEVYAHEIPGGQYSNLYQQAREVGLSSDEFHELTRRYKEVNDLLGDIIKVTPSSKVVGDMALLLHKQQLTGPELLSKKPLLDYPDSLRQFLKGHMGSPYGGFPKPLRDLVLGKDAPPPSSVEIDESETSIDAATMFQETFGQEPTAKELLSYRLYPKVFSEYKKHVKRFGDVSKLPTHAFFYGLQQEKEIAVDLEQGKRLYITLLGIIALFSIQREVLKDE